jgi:hypothetical protein
MVLGRPPKTEGRIEEGTDKDQDAGKYVVIFRHSKGTPRDKQEYAFAPMRRMDIMPENSRSGFRAIDEDYEVRLRPGDGCVISETTYQYYKRRSNILDAENIDGILVEEINFEKHPELVGKQDGHYVAQYLSIPFDWDVPFSVPENPTEEQKHYMTLFPGGTLSDAKNN